MLLKRNAGLLRYGIAVLLLLTLTACSSRFAYNHADFFIAWYVDDYLDFNRSQKKNFKAIVREQQVWHRTTQLALYQQQLEQLIAKVEAGQALDVEFIRWQSDQVKLFLRRIMRQSLPDMQGLLQSLSDKQVAYFLDELRDEQRQQEKTFAKQDQADIYQERQKEMRGAFKSWFGSTSKAQGLRIELWSQQLQDIYAPSLVLKRAWLVKVENLMQTGRQRTDFASQLDALFIEPQQFWPADYDAKTIANEDLTYRLWVELYALNSPKQKAHFVKRLKSYRKDVQILQQSR